jgi:dolichol-phosphate mannosyltransferase
MINKKVVKNLKQGFIGISMPVLNEAQNIGPVLFDIFKELKGLDFVICIVDDGSTDGTLDIIEDYFKKHGRIKLIKSVKKAYGCQRGAASRKALEWLVDNTKSDFFVEIDADGAQRPCELRSGLEYLIYNNCDVVIASKYLPDSKIIGRSFVRNFVSYVNSLVARLFIRAGIKDYSNSYRFYNRRAAEFILMFKSKYSSPIYLFDILAVWLANNFIVKEIPTIYVEKTDGNSKVTMLDIVKGFGGLLEISFRFRRGAFKK